MRSSTWIKKFLPLMRSEEGSALPLIGLGAMMLLASAGIAIDMGRVQVVQSRLSSSLDAAGLAAGATANTIDIQTEAVKYFDANFPTGYMGATINPLQVTSDPEYSLIVLDATGSVNTTFMRLFGVNSVAVSAHTEITRANKGMELVLIMDTTGSMDESAGGGVSKITAAKNAAHSLMDILYGSDTTAENLWIGLVPFAQAVNVGTSHASWTSDPSMPSPGWGPVGWAGCVDARQAGNRDTTDDPPSVALFPKYYWTCHDSYNDWYGNNSGKDDCDTTGGGFGYHTPLGTNRGPNKYCSQPVTPLSSAKATMTSAINAMTTDGNTHIVLGMAWGWRMLSPRWRGLWGGEMDAESLPLDYNTPLMNKVAILMTDGDNTISNSVRGAYGYLSNGYLGTTNQSTAENQLDSRLATVCTRMKAQNIIIYTVSFGTGVSTSVKNLLRGCATKPEYFFDSPTAASLETSFHVIGDSLANLRISK